MRDEKEFEHCLDFIIENSDPEIFFIPHPSSLIPLIMRLLIKLFYNPLQALAAIGERAPYFKGAAVALISGFLYYNLPSGDLSQLLSGLRNNGRGAASAVVLIYLFRLVMSGLAPALFLAAIFVPAVLLSASLVDRRSSVRVLLNQEYAPLVSAILYSWAAAHLLMLVPAWLLFQPAGSPLDEVALRLAPLPFFIFLVVLAVRVVLRMSYGRAVGVIALASLSLLALPLIPNLLFLLTSPFLLILLIVLLRNVFGDLLRAQQSRENFKRNLEISTLNPGRRLGSLQPGADIPAAPPVRRGASLFHARHRDRPRRDRRSLSTRPHSPRAREAHGRYPPLRRGSATGLAAQPE